MQTPADSIRFTPASLNGASTNIELTVNMLHEDSAGFLRRSLDELAQRGQQLRTWRQRPPVLATVNRQKTEFMAVFSHELRNSLGAIRNATVVLSKDKVISPIAAKARQLIERQVGQMTRLVEDLLDVTRINSGQLSLVPERLDLCALVKRAVQAAEFATQKRNHQVTVVLPDEPLWLQADPARLEQVLMNLLVNAAKYTDVGGEIGLSVHQAQGEAVIRVRDNGIGMAPKVLPHVFDLFFQADPAARRGDPGLGIGLALVRNLVESHGGRVTAASAGPKLGSEFTVRLPLAAEVSPGP
jgi:signal transduction histidine kinase